MLSMRKRSAAGLAPHQMHPIQVVARRTGLSADVIRAWEKRYGVVTPMRSDAGRRLYSDADVRRLRLLAQATLTGRTIGQLANLPDAKLAALAAAEDAESSVSRGDSTSNGGAPHSAATIDHRRACFTAVEQFDGPALGTSLRRAVVALSAEAFLDELVMPLWQRIEEMVRAGTLEEAHRHLALTMLRSVLVRMIDDANAPLAAPDLLVTAPAGQAHAPVQELSALISAAAAAAEGWRVTYIAPGLPAEGIADAATRVGARAVMLSLGVAPANRAVSRDVRRLRTLLPSNVAVVVDGAGADVHRGVIREIGAALLRDLPALRARLRALRSA